MNESLRPLFAADLTDNEPQPLRLGDVVAVIRRRMWLIVLVATAMVVGTYYYTTTLSPIYSAYGQLVLGEQGLSQRNDFDLDERAALNNSIVQGELVLLTSNEILARVARRLELETTAEFGPLSEEDSAPSLVDRATDLLRQILPRANPDPGPAIATEEGAEPSQIETAADANSLEIGDVQSVVGQLRQKIGVSQRGTSFVVSVRADTEDPKTAAAIVNVLMDEYIRFLSDKRFESATRVTDWLEVRVAELAEKLEQSEKEALAFRSVIEADADSSDRLDQQMRELTSKLVNARATLAETEARAQKVADIIDRDGLLPAADILTSNTILGLRGDLAQLRLDQTSASITFGEQSPQVQSIERSTTELEAAIEAEVNRSVLQLKNTAEIAAINVEVLERSLKRLENLILDRSGQLIRLNQLQRVVEANRSVYEEFLARFKSTSEIRSLRNSDAEVISYASPPSGPSFPNKKVSVLLAGIGGLILGCGLAVLLELRPEKFATVKQAAQSTGLPVYAELARPNQRRFFGRSAFVPPKVLSSPVLESARSLYRMAKLQSDNKKDVIAVTSAPGGTNSRSWTAFLLALMAARDEKSVVLIDADTRKAVLSKSLAPHANNNLLTTLYGRTNAKQSTKFLKDYGFDFIPTSVTVADPNLLMSNKAASHLLSDLRSQYDLVIVDCPYLEENSDTIATSHPFDLALFVVEEEQTRLDQTRSALPRFLTMTAEQTGLVFFSARRKLSA